MAPRFAISDIRFAERRARFVKPFRFGAVTVERAPQVFVFATVEVEAGRMARGAAAELMVPKWFDKNPRLSPDETVDRLRRSLAIARDLYLGEPRRDTAFGHHAARVADQVAACADEGIPALAAAFGQAEIDKALLDALLRALDMDVFSALRRNAVGLDARLTPDLDDRGVADFLAARRPLERVAVRHTVGMDDALDGEGGLGAVAAATGCRHFKIKLGGDPERDAARLAAVAATLAGLATDYRATVDANEQYADPAALEALIDALRRDPALAALRDRLLYIEQPLPRERTFEAPLGALGEAFPVIVDEADDSYDAFPRARALGYRGVSSKACKGLYKSLLNGARADTWSRAGRPSFVAAEDLTCQAGLALQQDTALVAFLGIDHAERNGHHYVGGFADTPEREARAFLSAHPDLYEERDGAARLRIRDGALSTRSLATPGFASAVLPMGADAMANHHPATELTT